MHVPVVWVGSKDRIYELPAVNPRSLCNVQCYVGGGGDAGLSPV